jgi:glycosyltransferase involved in cell wall biosynthesis
LDEVVIGSTGRLAPEKDNLTLIRALPLVTEALNGTRVVLLLAGDGPDRDTLAAAAQKLGCAEQVRFLGFCERIPDFLKAIDIFVSLSLREGLSISILEAMMAGRPIVASAIPPNAELVKHKETGLLVAAGREDLAAQAILDLIQRPDFGRDLGRRAREVVLEQYTLDRTLRETWELYVFLLNGSCRPVGRGPS